MTQMEQTLRALDAHGVSYQLYTHPAVFTIEEMEALDLEDKDNVAKNLFLRNANGKQHFLIVMKKDKHASGKGRSDAPWGFIQQRPRRYRCL